jgi:lysophospholipase L1-like esterase
VCACAALAVLACGGASPAPVRVLLVGDSITRGVVAGQGGPPYAERLAELLGDGYAIANLGIGGTNTQDWTRPAAQARFAREAPADLAVVLLGTNDAMGHPRREPLTPESYESALRELIGGLVASGVERVILMTPPPSVNPRAVRRLPSYRQRILAICDSEPHTSCGPDLLMLLDTAEDIDPIGYVHPTARGHEKIAAALAPAIRAAVGAR